MNSREGKQLKLTNLDKALIRNDLEFDNKVCIDYKLKRYYKRSFSSYIRNLRKFCS